MRLRYRVLPPAAPVEGGAPAPAASPAAGEVEIPAATVAKVIASIGGVSGLVTLLGFFLRDLPDAARTGAEAERCARLAVLATTLAPSDPTARALSLQLVIAADILHDPDRRLAAIARTPGGLPRWSPDTVPVACASGRQSGGTLRYIPAQPSSPGGLQNSGLPGPSHGAMPGSTPPTGTNRPAPAPPPRRPPSGPTGGAGPTPGAVSPGSRDTTGAEPIDVRHPL